MLVWKMNWDFLSIFLELELIIYVFGSWAELCWLERLNHVGPLHLLIDGLLSGSESLSI